MSKELVKPAKTEEIELFPESLKFNPSVIHLFSVLAELSFKNLELKNLLNRCLPYVEPEVEQQGYGFFPGGDPTKFSPDEDNTPAEHEAWKTACEAWNERKEAARGSHVNIFDTDGRHIGHATVANLGMGIYTYEDEEAKEIVEKIQALEENK